jgi:hypothetical protein
MKANGAIGDRHHHTALDLVSKLSKDLADQCGDVGAAEAFAPDGDHRRSAHAADRQQPMDVRIQGHDHATLIERQPSDLGIACPAVPNVGNVADIKTAFLDVPNGTAWQALV